MTGSPEVWSVAETFGFSSVPKDYTPPEGWVLDPPQGGQVTISHLSTIGMTPPDLSQLRLTSFTTFQPSYFSSFPDLYLPDNGSVVTIVAPRGTVIDSYPAATTDEITGTNDAATTFTITMGPLDSSPSKITFETTPSWGRDPNFSILWTLSASTIIAFGLSIFWMVVGALFQTGATAVLKRGWRRIRPGLSPTVSP